MRKVSPPPPPEPVPLCVLATTLTGQQCVELGKNPARAWQRCGHPELPQGSEIVCTCKGCKPSCPGYKADSESNTGGT